MSPRPWYTRAMRYNPHMVRAPYVRMMPDFGGIHDGDVVASTSGYVPHILETPPTHHGKWATWEICKTCGTGSFVDVRDAKPRCPGCGAGNHGHWCHFFQDHGDGVGEQSTRIYPREWMQAS